MLNVVSAKYKRKGKTKQNYEPKMTTKQQNHRNHRRLSDSNVISSIDFLIRIEKVFKRATNNGLWRLINTTFQCLALSMKYS